VLTNLIAVEVANLTTFPAQNVPYRINLPLNMISIWEKQSFTDTDVVIVGGGLTGMATAASILENRPTARVTILERGTLPTGASTKNAGFACFGSVTELLNDTRLLGEDRMVQLVERRWRGLQLTRQRLGDQRIGLEAKHGHELFRDTVPLEGMEKVNALLQPLFNRTVFAERHGLIAKFGFGDVGGLIENPLEAQLHTGKLVQSLWRYIAERGATVLTGTPVERFEQRPGGLDVWAGGIHFRCKKLVFCTNAFTKTLLPEIELKPGRGIVLFVRTETPVKFHGTFHYDEGYYYFRDFDGGVIFGGGRNLGLEQEATTEFGINERILEKLKHDLGHIILPGMLYQIEMQWSGIMAFGENKWPVVQEVQPNVYAGVRLGGMGVAISSLVGEELAGMVGI
jgi:glycine/D-amino acid oxidase-like deaminating enzyme